MLLLLETLLLVLLLLLQLLGLQVAGECNAASKERRLLSNAAVGLSAVAGRGRVLTTTRLLRLGRSSATTASSADRGGDQILRQQLVNARVDEAVAVLQLRCLGCRCLCRCC